MPWENYQKNFFFWAGHSRGLGNFCHSHALLGVRGIFWEFSPAARSYPGSVLSGGASIAKVLRTEVPAVSMDGTWSPELPTDALRALFGSRGGGGSAP